MENCANPLPPLPCTQDLPLAWRPLPMSPLCSPGLAWCYGQPVSAHPPVCHLPRLSSVCHLLSLSSPPEPGRFACHCAACCSVCPCSAISLSQGHSGGFQLLCYIQPCVSPIPLLIVPWVSHSRSGVTSSGAPGPSQIGEEGRGPSVSFLVTWASVWIYWVE